MRVQMYWANNTMTKTKLRLRKYIKLLRVAYKQLPEALQDKNVVLKVHWRMYPYDDESIAAQCWAGEEIVFYNREQDTFPDLESLTWLLAHEMAHWKLNHKMKGEKLEVGEKEAWEKEAREYQTIHGFPWKEEYCFK